jgi:hypothetical protein
MRHFTGESRDDPVRVDLDREITLEFHRSTITGDAISGVWQ